MTAETKTLRDTGQKHPPSPGQGAEISQNLLLPSWWCQPSECSVLLQPAPSHGPSLQLFPKTPTPGHRFHQGLACSVPQSLALHAMHATTPLQSTGEGALGGTGVKPIPLTANERAGNGEGCFLASS